MFYLLFILVPAVELYLLIEVGKAIGTPATIGLIFLTGVIGATLARLQGLTVISRLQGEMSAGRLPADAMMDGLLILVAGALLITPGVLTDAVGFILLIPPSRILLKRLMKARFRKAMEEGRARMNVRFEGESKKAPADPAPGRGIVIDQEDVP